MNYAEFQLRGIDNSRLAVHATSAFPVWLWSPDGARIWWANPVGAGLFGAANASELAEKIFGPADQQRRQVAQLAGRLPASGAIRLERLRGFGASLGRLITCGCARLDFADGSHGILVAATEKAGRAMPLAERLQHLIEGIDAPIAAFARDGTLIGASAAARPLLRFRNLTEAGLEQAGNDALKQGRVETPVGTGHMVLQRVGSGADAGLVALLAPGATEAALSGLVAPSLLKDLPDEPAQLPVPDYEQPAQSNEAPAEFALIDAFAEPAAAANAVMANELPEPDLQSVLQVDMPHVEASHAETTAPETQQHEPSPYVEAVADEPAAGPAEPAPSAPDPRRHPLRFMWQMDRDGRFLLGSDEFVQLIGARTAAGFGRPWHEIADSFGLDPEGRVARAVATRDTWSGITLNWPVDDGGRLPVELSGLPVHDRERNFDGYRGFGSLPRPQRPDPACGAAPP